MTKPKLSNGNFIAGDLRRVSYINIIFLSKYFKPYLHHRAARIIKFCPNLSAPSTATRTHFYTHTSVIGT